jgi:hypothetical protein
LNKLRAAPLFDIVGARLPIRQIALNRRQAIHSSIRVLAVNIRAPASTVLISKVSSACAIR